MTDVTANVPNAPIDPLAKPARNPAPIPTTPINPAPVPVAPVPVAAPQQPAQAPQLPPPPASVFEQVFNSVPTPPQQPNRSIFGELFAGISEGASNIRDTGIALEALSENLVGDAEGQQQAVQELIQRQSDPTRISPSVDFDAAFKTPMNFAKWLAFNVGAQVPNMGTILASGGVGGAIGAAVARKAITKEVAEAGAKLTLKKTGAFGGAFTAGTALNTGEVVSEQINATGTVNSEVAISAGIAKGALETISPMMMGKALGFFDEAASLAFKSKVTEAFAELTKKPTKKILDGLKIGLVEGATETAQEAINIAARAIVDEEYDPLTKDAAKRLIEAGITGAFVGGVFGVSAESIGSIGRGAGKPAGLETAVTTDVSNKETTPILPGSIPNNFDQTAEQDVRASTITDTSDLQAEIFTEDAPFGLGLYFNTAENASQFYADRKSNRTITENNLLDLNAIVVDQPADVIQSLQQLNFLETSDLLVQPKNVRQSQNNPDVFIADDVAFTVVDRPEGTEIRKDSELLATVQEGSTVEQTIANILNSNKRTGKDVLRTAVRDTEQMFLQGLLNDGGAEVSVIAETVNSDGDTVLATNDPALKKAVRVQAFEFVNSILSSAGIQGHTLNTFSRINPDQKNKRVVVYDNDTLAELQAKTVGGANAAISVGAVPINYGELRDRLDSMNLKQVELETPGFGTGEAMFTNNVDKGMRILIEATSNPEWSLDHEAIHALRAKNLFTQTEWDTLTKEAESKWIRKYAIEERYTGESKELQIEEAIAEAFGEWASESPAVQRQQPKSIRSIFQKILDFITALRDTVFPGLSGSSSTERIFKRVKNGDVGLRAMEIALGTAETFGPEMPGRSVYDNKLNTWVTPQASTQTSKKMVSVLAQLNGAVADQKAVQQSARAADYFSWIAKYGWNVVQLAKRNLHIDFLQEYVTSADRWYNTKMQWTVRASETIKAWKNVGKEQADALGKVLFELDQMTYLDKNDKPRNPTNDELIAIFKKHGLKSDGVKVYQRIVEDFKAYVDAMEDAAIGSLRVTDFENPLILEAEKGRIRKSFEPLRNRPYFPHSRFGRWSIVVKSRAGGTVYTELFESKKERAAAYQSIRREYPRDEFAIREDYISDESTPFTAMPPSLLVALKNHLELTTKQKEDIDNFMLMNSPAQSFRKRMVRRKNIKGYSQDAQRSFADYFWHGANHLARITHGGDMQNIIDEANRDLSTAEGNVDNRRQIIEFLQNHLNHIMNPGPDWAQLRSIAFTWWIGFSPASAALNFTQVPMVTAPYLAERFSTAKATSAIIDAYRWTKDLYLKPADTIKSAAGVDYQLIRMGVKQGFLDESQATELANTASGSVLTRMRYGTQVQRGLNKFAEWGAWMFQQTEQMNRRVTFRAAVQLARENPTAPYLKELKRTMHGDYIDAINEHGLSEADAAAFLAGKDAVRTTQFEYASWARPRFMRGRLGTLFVFQMYTQNILWFASQSPGGRKYLLTLLLMGGLMGLPGAEDLASVAKFLARKIFGVNFDLEEEVRKLVVEVAGENSKPDLLLHGVAKYGFGLGAAAQSVGVPIPTVDMSNAIGMGRIIPGLSELGSNRGNFEERVGQSAAAAGGAAAGIMFNILKFLSDDQLPVLDPKRFERVLPRAFRDLARGARWIDEGQERTRSGARLIGFDTSEPLQVSEALARAAGFNPTVVSQRWSRIIAQREVELFWTNRRSLLMRQFFHASVVGDKESRQDAIDAIKAFNKTLPYKSLRITKETLQRSFKNRMRNKKLQEQGIARQKAVRPIYEDVQQLHVEDVTNRR